MILKIVCFMFGICVHVCVCEVCKLSCLRVNTEAMQLSWGMSRPSWLSLFSSSPPSLSLSLSLSLSFPPSLPPSLSLLRMCRLLQKKFFIRANKVEVKPKSDEQTNAASASKEGESSSSSLRKRGDKATDSPRAKKVSKKVCIYCWSLILLWCLYNYPHQWIR